MDSSTWHIIGIAGGIGVGVVLTRLAWRGRRIGERACCAHCDYSLTGLPDTSSRCPECGTTVSLASGLNIRTGGRRPATGWVMVCLLLIAAGLYWEQRQVRDWFNRPAARKPSWVLVRDTHSTVVANRQAAMAELFVRDDNNRLSPRHHSALVDAAIANPGMGGRRWTEGTVGWIVEERALGKVNDVQWKRLFDTNAPTYQVRPIISSTEPFRIDYKTGGLGWGCTGHANYTFKSILIAGRPIKSPPQHREPIDLARELPDLPAGRHEIVIVTAARMWGKRWGEGDQWTGQTSVTFDYRTDGSSTLERVRGEDDIAALKKAIVPELKCSPSGAASIGFTLPSNLPVCHDVVLRVGRTETHLFQIEGGPFSGIGTTRTGMFPAGVTSADLILTPNPAAAARTPQIMKLVDAEIVFKDVPIVVAKN